jgi:hypothetical protein
MEEGDAPKEPLRERIEHELCPTCRHLDGLLCLKTRILFKKGESFLFECNCFESLMNSSIPPQSDAAESSQTNAINTMSQEAEIIEEELTDAELEERHSLEQQVEQAFYLAGFALKRLRDGRLYRSTHATFTDYCLDRFAYSRRQMDYLIAAAEVYEHLQTRTICSQILPTRENQVRPLTNLEPELQVEIWQQAVSEAGNKVPPARVVKSVVDRIREKKPVPNPWRIGEVAEMVVKDNPSLRGRGGCWCIITEVLDFSCIVQMWDREIQVKIENLKTLDLPPDQQEEIRRLCDRLNRLTEISELDRSARVLLASLGRQTFLTDVEEQLLGTLESYYLKLT